MVLLERDENVRIRRTDGAGVAVSDVDAADGQSDIGHYAVELVRRNRLANFPLDSSHRRAVSSIRVPTWARTWMRIWPASTDGKKFCPRKGTNPNDRQSTDQESGGERFGRLRATARRAR